MLEQRLAIMGSQIFVHCIGHSHLHSKKQNLAPKQVVPLAFSLTQALESNLSCLSHFCCSRKHKGVPKEASAREGSCDRGESHITSKLKSCFVVRIKEVGIYVNCFTHSIFLIRFPSLLLETE